MNEIEFIMVQYKEEDSIILYEKEELRKKTFKPNASLDELIEFWKLAFEPYKIIKMIGIAYDNN